MTTSCKTPCVAASSRGSQIADRHPCPVRELEIFGDPAGEAQAAARVGRIDKGDGVADPVETFIVKGRRRQIRPAKIAWRHIRAAHAGLIGVAGGDELQFHPGAGSPNSPGVSVAQCVVAIVGAVSVVP